MEANHLQIDDLRECRQAWAEYEECRRDALQYRREEWPGYTEHKTQRGVFEIDMGE